jgi:membrane-associated protease RseP (regulator of RpoE activity)
MTTLLPPKAPNLPLAPITYNAQYLEQLTNALRLYFNTIDNFTQNVNIPASGDTASRPISFLEIGQFYFDVDLGFPVWWNGTNWVDATGTIA